MAERRILSCGGEIGYARHSGVVNGRCRNVEDGVDVGNNNDDDDDDDAKDDDDDDTDDGNQENEDDSSACKRITLRGRTKTANPVILFQTRRRTAASRKGSKRSTTSN